MKHRWLLYLFGINLVAELVALHRGLADLRYITKPLLMVLLGLLVWLQPISGKKIKILLLLAIIFSLGGDIFLLFDKHDSSFFIFGLISFLLAHIFYIILFLHIKKIHLPLRKWNPWIIASLLLYVVSLFYVLNPHLGDLKIPVIVYALILGGMMVTAIHAFKFTSINGNGVIIGAFLFVLSDSMLAINKFYAPFSLAGIAIMLTYALAQLLIVMGVIKFTCSTDKP